MRLTKLLADCGIAAHASSTECSDYPCVSALEGADAQGLEALDKGCGGKEGISEDEWPAVVPMSADCGNGELRTMYMFAVVDKPTVNVLYQNAQGGLFPEDMMFLGARRAKALARGWGGCGE